MRRDLRKRNFRQPIKSSQCLNLNHLNASDKLCGLFALLEISKDFCTLNKIKCIRALKREKAKMLNTKDATNMIRSMDAIHLTV